MAALANLPKRKSIEIKDLDGRQKIATLLLTLGAEHTTRIFSRLDEREVEQISLELSTLPTLSGKVINDVIEEFYQMVIGQENFVEGGIEHAAVVLERAFGKEKAFEIIERLKILSATRGFDILKKADPAQLAGFLTKEHPQTVALILSHISPDQASEVIDQFSEELKIDVLVRIATLGKVSPQILAQVEAVVDSIAEQTLSQNLAMAGGSQLVAAILNKTNTNEAKYIMEQIEGKDGNLANEIKRLMFLFEDILMIDDKGIQRVLRDVDKRDLALSLKASDEKIRTKVFKNMSERASATIKEELEFMGPIKLKEVEAAQQRIVEVIKRLEQSEEIAIGGRGKEDVFV